MFTRFVLLRSPCSQAVNLGREAQYFPLHYQTRYQRALKEFLLDCSSRSSSSRRSPCSCCTCECLCECARRRFCSQFLCRGTRSRAFSVVVVDRRARKQLAGLLRLITHMFSSSAADGSGGVPLVVVRLVSLFKSRNDLTKWERQKNRVTAFLDQKESTAARRPAIFHHLHTHLHEAHEVLDLPVFCAATAVAAVRVHRLRSWPFRMMAVDGGLPRS